MLNRTDRSSPTPGEADVKYLDGDFRVVRPGAFVRCAVTGVQIPLEELRYWSVDLQEAYATPEAVMQRQVPGYSTQQVLKAQVRPTAPSTNLPELILLVDDKAYRQYGSACCKFGKGRIAPETNVILFRRHQHKACCVGAGNQRLGFAAV